ncbi:hypothetical protein TARUN_8213 [Trichoderma arundinaceum]|uniref:Uncharacterized protein n=1 Tax=Trichoderma arundinaceum TaxID=490622 RepID=A0A395NDJ3_TRIAR|nr:hypothetical protein TARUN_8213 [Trichoderma arundinaceum]
MIFTTGAFQGHFGGSCGNCKWRDYAARCSLHDGPGARVRRSRSASSSRPPQGRRRRPGRLGSAGNPINLDSDGDDTIEVEGDYDYEYESEEDEDEEEGTIGNPIRLLEN